VPASAPAASARWATWTTRMGMSISW
jgi:hypothetical protein